MRGDGMKGRGLLWVSGLVFKSDFTNGMGIGGSNWTGRSRAASCLVAPSPAIRGGTPPDSLPFRK